MAIEPFVWHDLGCVLNVLTFQSDTTERCGPRLLTFTFCGHSMFNNSAAGGMQTPPLQRTIMMVDDSFNLL